MEFLRPGADRVALADPSYIQHNSVFKKRGRKRRSPFVEHWDGAVITPPAPAPASAPRP